MDRQPRYDKKNIVEISKKRQRNLVGIFYNKVYYILLQTMALGNQVGRIFVWDIDVEDPVLAK